jgi:hypothetical protein
MKKLSMLLVVFLLLNGCSTWSRTFFAKNLTNVQLGGKKEDVVRQLGGVATPVAAQNYEGHFLEVLEFSEKPFYVGRVNKAYWTRYWVYFMDGRMVKYQKAYAADVFEHDKWVADVMATAATMDAFKGTALMPLQANQSAQHSGQVNVNANVSGNVRVDS